jgi:TolB-like protein
LSGLPNANQFTSTFGLNQKPPPGLSDLDCAFISISEEPRRHVLRRRNGRRIDCLAVLPLSSEPADPELEFLAKTFVERLIDNISRLSGTRVLAYSTVQHCRDADLDPRTIGEKLFVRAVVTGEIVQHSDELLLHLELIGVEDGTQLWGAQFRGSRSDCPCRSRETGG